MKNNITFTSFLSRSLAGRIVWESLYGHSISSESNIQCPISPLGAKGLSSESNTHSPFPPLRGARGVFIAILLLFQFQLLQASEVIHLFKSEIEVLESSDLIITETIKVRAEGYQIKRGIFRAIPNNYRSKKGVNFKVKYEVLEVLKNGSVEDYHLKKQNGFTFIYVGNENIFLQKGDYTYTIKYKTNKQIGYFEDFDELYWNVNGLQWDFTIEKVEAIITLPMEADLDNFTAYTGARGESNKDYKATQLKTNKIKFESTKIFNPNENLTIAVAWQKGVVYQPSKIEEIMIFFQDNLIIFIGLFGTLFAFLLHLINWRKVGEDPPMGTVIPIFKPMGNLSPSAMRYILKMKIDNKAFTAAIVSIATKGALKINKKSSIYSLVKNAEALKEPLTKSETALYNAVFSSGNTFTLTNSKHYEISSAMRIFNNAEKDMHQENYFKLNRKNLIPGIGVSFITVVGMFYLRNSTFEFSSLLKLVPFIFFIVIMFKNVKTLPKNILGIIFGVIFLFVFLGLGNTTTTSLSPIEVVVLGIVVVFLIFLNLLFTYLMKAPTLFGRKEMDKIEGFKMYLKTAEEERLDAINLPNKTPQLFEKYLPYAIALDCENQWAKKFKSIIEDAIKSGDYVQPNWYIGRGMHFNPGNFTNDIGRKFNNAVTSSSIAPSQRSLGSGGSSGGGFSGGGGGGGGGGGW